MTNEQIAAINAALAPRYNGRAFAVGDRAQIYGAGDDRGGSHGSARWASQNARQTRCEDVTSGESRARVVNERLHNGSRQISGNCFAGAGGHPVSPQFRFGLALIAALTIGSIIFHVIWGS